MSRLTREITFTVLHIILETYCLQCFYAVGWAAVRASGCTKLSGGILA